MIIRGGRVVSSSGIVTADVHFDGERIAKIAKSIPVHSGQAVVDAAGLLVFPGMVDAHVHMRDFKEQYKEDWFSGTSAALAGGVTTVIDMPNSSLATTSIESLEAKKRVAAAKALCDYAFFLGATPHNAPQVARLASDSHVAGLKVFMGASTGSLEAGDFASLYSHFGAFKKPIAVHAEDAGCLRYFSDKSEKAVVNHDKLRDELCAQLAVSTAVDIARRTGARLHVCHLTTLAELELVADAKKEGVKVTCEVTPHHLFLSDADCHRLGNFAKVNPPLRPKRDQEALWKGIIAGTVDAVATDHAPHSKDEKLKPYSEAPAGMPGLETALPLLLTAVHEKRLTLEAIARLYSESPARIYGLREKGAVAEGRHADVVLVDPKAEWAVKGDGLFTKCRWSAFERHKMVGKVARVFLRGAEVFDGSSIVAAPASGRLAKVG